MTGLINTRPLPTLLLDYRRTTPTLTASFAGCCLMAGRPGHGPEFHRLACNHGLEGIVSKRINGRYEPDRRTWLKIKCLNREEFVVVGWSDPEGSRHRIGALLLGYYTPEAKLIYAGRVGTGMPIAELERLWQRLQPFVVDEMPLDEPPPRGTRFGSPLVLSR